MANSPPDVQSQPPFGRVGLPSSPREFLFPQSPSATLHPSSPPTHLSPTTFKCGACGAVRRPFHSPSSSTSTGTTVFGSPQPSLKVEDAEGFAVWGQQPRQAPPPTPKLPQPPQFPQTNSRNEQQNERKTRPGLFSSCFGQQSKKSKQPKRKKQREPLYLVENLHWTER